MSEESGIHPPIIIDLGKAKKKRVRRLKRGRGRLMDEVQDTLEEVRQRLGDQAKGKELVPVVMIYRKRRKRKGLLF